MASSSVPASVLSVPEPRVIRDELTELVRRDLIGPAGGEHEEFPTGQGAVRLYQRYPVGCLAPRGVAVNPAELDDLAEGGDSAGDDDAGADRTPAMPTFFPSSMGLSFAVDAAETAIAVDARWGRYVRTESEHPGEDGRHVMVWRRVPQGGRVTIALVEGSVEPVAPDAEQPEVTVRGQVRMHDGQWVVSLFMVNGMEPEGPSNATWIFQCELVVRSASSREAPFHSRELLPEVQGTASAAVHEARMLAMRYRHTPAFAVGHGVGVAVRPAADNPARAVEVRTEAMPTYEMPATTASGPSDSELLAGVELDMKKLAAATPEQLQDMLPPIVAAYQAWIVERVEQAASDSTVAPFAVEAETALAECRRAAERIQAGIDTLVRDRAAWEAFGFANRAMALQRVHSVAAAARRADSSLSLEAALAEADKPRNHSWRLFQLAFLLMGIPALADPTHPERHADQGLVDLLWFPTGGGKTEAYLGLAAFTMAIRRRHGDRYGLDASAGVAVLMRYTLRLLTVQQFQRAAALICAAEVIRREDPNLWGAVPFRLGLWVGMGVTPNKTEDAKAWVDEKRGQRKGRPSTTQGSPHQLTTCPWCGGELPAERAVEVDMTTMRTTIACTEAGCAFTLRSSGGEGLPVLVVDQEIYRLLPAFVIATVDKFAQLPWQGPVQALFGKVSAYCPRHGYKTPSPGDCDAETGHAAARRHPAVQIQKIGFLRPPDLIVQDELHLISGPLGSLVGLYETAVDTLSTWTPQLPGSGPVRPKVVASTATVRGAAAQVRGLYGASLAVFPPPGINAQDSFFARTRSTEVLPGRRYVGVCAHGRKFRALLIRLYVASMAAAQLLHERYGGGPVTDPYMTLVGYFGSLRELGGMRRLVDDDVATRLYEAEQLGFARRDKPVVEELTSRLHSAHIPDTLRRLELPVPIKHAKGSKGPRPVDVLLATNMISVGVDVSRLGLMVTAGQPKSAAEYIQATSRVGRQAPGLVFTAFNWARPRDLSHYETFEHFHTTAYRHVEALSVTPFADRALDRGLTAVLVSLIRQHDAMFNANRAADDMNSYRHSPKVAELVNAVVNRARVVTGDRDIAERIGDRLARTLDRWAEQASTPHRRLGYKKTDAHTVALLDEPGAGSWTEWTCPTSLRNVESGIRLLLRSDLDLLGPEGEHPYEPYRRPSDTEPDPMTAALPPDQEPDPVATVNSDDDQETQE